MTRLKNVHKHSKDLHVVNDMNLEVRQGEMVVVCGPSGGGKSTLIHTVNQPERIESSGIWVDSVSVADPKTDLNKVREEVGFMFQGFDLYPRLTVLENIILSPMKVKNQSREETEKKAMELLKCVGLVCKEDALPDQLSDDQQQRVVTARGLAMEPHVMLFDEPTSTLDPKMVGEVLGVMKDLAESDMTMMCIAHEMGFTRGIADRVVFIDKGQILEDETPEEFFTSPKHEHAKQFLQQMMTY